jgi:hypothetical protein
MPVEPFSENGYESDTLIAAEQHQFPMLLHTEMSEAAEGRIYFSLPGQDNYLYEYEGDLDAALQDLPEILSAIPTNADFAQSASPDLILTPQATATIDQLWAYFDRTGEQTLEGTQEYNFQVDGDRLFILFKIDIQAFVAISRDGQIESTFSSEQQENLMERFAIAYEQSHQTDDPKPSNAQDWELG